MRFLLFSNKPKALLTTKTKVVSTSFPTESKLVQHFSTGPKLFQPFFQQTKVVLTVLSTDPRCFKQFLNSPKAFSTVFHQTKYFFNIFSTGPKLF
jgi:hypothetical protein